MVFLCSIVPFCGLCQFNWAEIGVNGLTCSQCTRSVEMEIKKLEFVKDVEMDLEHTKGKITFKDGTFVNVDKIAKAVEAAGFSVRYLKAEFTFNNTTVSNDGCFSYGDKTYQFVKTVFQSLHGEVQIKFIGENFLPKSEYKVWRNELKPKCNDKEKVVYVTLP